MGSVASSNYVIEWTVHNLYDKEDVMLTKTP